MPQVPLLRVASLALQYHSLAWQLDPPGYDPRQNQKEINLLVAPLGY
jgi:hypothetical protein